MKSRIPLKEIAHTASGNRFFCLRKSHIPLEEIYFFATKVGDGGTWKTIFKVTTDHSMVKATCLYQFWFRRSLHGQLLKNHWSDHFIIMAGNTLYVWRNCDHFKCRRFPILKWAQRGYVNYDAMVHMSIHVSWKFYESSVKSLGTPTQFGHNCAQLLHREVWFHSEHFKAPESNKSNTLLVNTLYFHQHMEE